jgi:hypothetical protein
MEPSPPGWYRDPKRPGGRRYWDGQDWVDVDGVLDSHTGPRPPAAGPRLISQRQADQEDRVAAETTDEVDTESQAD